MSLTKTVASCGEQLRTLRDALAALEVTVNEDRPASGDTALVDQLGDRVCELLGNAEECLEHLSHALEAAEVGALSSALARAQQALDQCASRYQGELANHDATAALLRMGQERGRDWRAWSRVVKQAVEQCGPTLGAAQRGLTACWSELSECLPRVRQVTAAVTTG